MVKISVFYLAFSWNVLGWEKAGGAVAVEMLSMEKRKVRSMPSFLDQRRWKLEKGLSGNF